MAIRNEGWIKLGYDDDYDTNMNMDITLGVGL